MNSNKRRPFSHSKEVQKYLDIISRCSLVQFVAAGNTIPEMQVSFAHSLTEEDVVIGISNSGDSKILLDIFEIAKKRKATTISITNHIKSPLSQLASIQLTCITNEKLFFKEFSFTRFPSISVNDTLFLLLSKINLDNSFQSISD
ncbi:MurR/RpiR family transcriptional regulator [Metabacillus sp. RGM 3146]|uniref:MurR/RpiR family transcriptional regulator n=1 Tax=Metabacillus sp. RGM 3146 TaxID=3401092 RepID=UPI003B9AF799